MPTTIHDLFRRSVDEYADRPAVITEEGRLTYRQLADLVDEYARALVASGCEKGSRVALLMENDPQWIAFALGATSIGAVFVPVSTFVRADDLAYHLRNSDVSHLFMSAAFLDNEYLAMLVEIVPGLERAEPGPLYLPDLPALRQVVVRGSELLPDGCDSWTSLLEAGAAVPDAVLAGLREELDPEDECYLLTTSGTTARPKGVLHTHGALAGNGSLIGDYQGLTADDVVWFYFPLFFSAGCINVMLGTLSHGACLIVQPVMDVRVTLELIEREKATTWHLWPHQLKRLLAHPDWASRSHDTLHKGTAPFDMLIESTPPDGLGGVNMYGMTETATAFSCTGADEPLEIRLNTQGHLLPGNEIKVVDPETGERLPNGEPGEICVKGPAVMRRYYKVDPATTFDSEGFFHTGDLGYVDADGRVHFDQRLKDVIKTGGINVSPADIEATLQRIPGVEAAHVFGLPDTDRGEMVGAALVTGAELDETAVLEFCQGELPGYKRPIGFLVLAESEVPMTGSGKVQKHILREHLVEALKNHEGPLVGERF